MKEEIEGVLYQAIEFLSGEPEALSNMVKTFILQLLATLVLFLAVRFKFWNIITNIIEGRINVEGYKEVAKKLVQIFGFEKVAISIRTSITATRNLWQGVIYDGDIYYSKQYDIEIVDRIGAGDCFAGGIISAALDGERVAEAVADKIG